MTIHPYILETRTNLVREQAKSVPCLPAKFSYGGCGVKVLRPFLLRRLKTEVEKGLPPKKEIILKVGLTDMQRQYYKMLLQKDFDAINGTGERSRLLNVVMQVSVSFIRQSATIPPPHVVTSVCHGGLAQHKLPARERRVAL